jgi:hypothetical protein
LWQTAVSLQFHPADSSFDASSLTEFRKIIEYLLANGYSILLPSEYVASISDSLSAAGKP